MSEDKLRRPPDSSGSPEPCPNPSGGPQTRFDDIAREYEELRPRAADRWSPRAGMIQAGPGVNWVPAGETEET